MLRGVNRQIIEVNNTGNKYFEKILLFVNPDLEEKERGKIDAQAGEILKNLGKTKPFVSYKRKKGKIQWETAIGFGLVLSAVITVLMIIKF